MLPTDKTFSEGNGALILSMPRCRAVLSLDVMTTAIKPLWVAVVCAAMSACAHAPPTGGQADAASRPAPEKKEAKPLQEPPDVFELLTKTELTVGEVEAALRSDQPDIRLAGLMVVARLGTRARQLDGQIRAMSEDRVTEVRIAVAQLAPALDEKGGNAASVDVLRKLLKDREEAVRIAALESARRMGAEAAPLLDDLETLATGDDPLMRAIAIDVSCFIGSEAGLENEVLPLAVAGAGHRSVAVRMASMRGLGFLEEHARPYYDLALRGTRDVDPGVKVVALRAISKIDATRAWDRCIQTLDDENEEVVAVSGACLKGAEGDVVDQLLMRYRMGDKQMSRAMAMLLAAADSSAAPAVALAAREKPGARQALLTYSLWHLSRRGEAKRNVSRWDMENDESFPQSIRSLEKIAGFLTRKTDVDDAKRACVEQWGGLMLPVEDDEGYVCFNHELRHIQVAVKLEAKQKRELDTGDEMLAAMMGDDIEVSYQFMALLESNDGFGLQVAMLQLLEDRGCRYRGDRIAERAACEADTGNIEVRLVPTVGVVVMKEIAEVP